MAIRELITKNLEAAKGNAFKPTSTEYKELIKELIRLDVPILEIGSSSIGKSYSIRQFMEEAGVKGEFLFVGTEKSEFIEGIPNLKEITAGQAKFSYLKPYWFPDKEEIRARLINGRQQILQNQDPTVLGLWNNAKNNFKLIEDLKIQLLKYRRTEESVKAAKKENKKIGKYIYEDALLYLSTLQGYGNFWLILDEIDKVEKQDKDKYAPLLHIVRERELKGWKLSGLRDYPEYDIKYVETIDMRIKRLDAALADPTADVTDTRIIAIANDLQTLEEESPALYRRFVKIIIRNSLYDEKEVQLPNEEKEKEKEKQLAIGYDWSKLYEIKKQQFHTCVVNKEVEAPENENNNKPQKSGIKSNMISISEAMAIIEEEKTGKVLDEMNLAWTLGFWPEILFPGTDTRKQGAGLINNKLIQNFNDTDKPYDTLLFVIIQNNFDTKYWVPLLECIYDKVSVQFDTKSSSGEDAEVDALFEREGMTRSKFNSPNPLVAEKIINAYKTKLKFAEDKYSESIEIQRRKQRGESGVTDKSLAGVEGGVANTSRDAIVFGNVMIQRSMDGNKPTEFTRMLISSVPFLQTKFIASPSVPFDGAKALMEIADNGMVNFIIKVSGEKFKNEAEAKEAAKKAFSMIEPYKPFVVKYGIAAPEEYVDAFVDGDYRKITNPAETIRKIIQNKPVIIDSLLSNMLSPSEKNLKKEYFESISNVKMIEKEVFQNLTYEVWPMIKNSAEQQGMTPTLKDQVKYYVEKFPNTMTTLANSLDDTDGLDELKLFILDFAPTITNGSELDSMRKLANGGGVGQKLTKSYANGGDISLVEKDGEYYITGIKDLKTIVDNFRKNSLGFELNGRLYHIVDVNEKGIDALNDRNEPIYIGWANIDDDGKGLNIGYNDWNNYFYFKLTNSERSKYPYNKWMEAKANMEDRFRDYEDSLMAKGGKM